MNRLTKTTYSKLTFGIFQCDKLMIAFNIAYNLMKTETVFDQNHLEFVIKGPFADNSNNSMLTQVEKDEREYLKNRKLKEENP
jgi:hypothetical protein